MKLKKSRNEIDKIDKKLAKLLNKRFLIVEKIKEIKIENQINIENLNREKEIISKNSIYVNDLYKNQYKEIYKTIFKLSKDLQK